MINIANAGARYSRGRWLFRQLTLNVSKGEMCVILGPNGTGKTTLLKTILGVNNLAEGHIDRPAHIGHVPQNLEVLFDFSVLDIVLMGSASKNPGLFSSPSAGDYSAAEAALADVNMSPFSDQAFSSLSGGERQLVLLARAIASGSNVILLDEPTAALDLANEEKVLSTLARLKAGGATLLMSTHNPEHAMRLADSVLLMKQDGSHRCGSADKWLTDEALSDLYGVPLTRVDIDSPSGPLTLLAKVGSALERESL